MKQVKEKEWHQGTVPGTVYTDLLTQGLIVDPYVGENEDEVRDLSYNDYLYEREFLISKEVLNNERNLLICKGIDTIADLLVNGKQIGICENMHREYEFDLTGFLKEGVNRIRVYFHSPMKYMQKLYEKKPLWGVTSTVPGYQYIRKAHCMFGWDWGPKLPDMGIWRDIYIEEVNGARIQNVQIRQQNEEEVSHLSVVLKNEVIQSDAAGMIAECRVYDPEGRELTLQTEDVKETQIFQIEIKNPERWWPNGYGEQKLYRVCVSLKKENHTVQERSIRFGIRDFTVVRRPDEWGAGFTFCINGMEIFAKGANYIPEDSIFGKRSKERTERLLKDCRRANFNCIRVWGGGCYPDDYFYDLCDELGLLVWQDFMFACAVYNLTDAFEENITAEFVDNVRRLRHHASLALWCGNNEMEQFVAQGEWVTSMRQKADYIKMYEYIIPKVLKAEDPQAFYWPASPSSGGSFDDPQDPTRGDVHYWMVWHGLLPFTDYRNHQFRYVSEFGFQSFPCMETIESFTAPEDRNVFSYVMEKHQRNASANGRILFYLSQMYLYPRSLELLVYASQLLQAQAMQYGVEHWRRHRGCCMGAVVWQLNDCWPVASWASIDYFGRWKALHYYEKRFFAPVLISCHEEGILSQNTNVNAEPFGLKKSAHLNVSNETMQEFRGKAKWSLRRPDASVIEEGSFDVTVPALSAVWLPEQDFSNYGTYDTYYSYQLLDEAGNGVGEGSVLFCAPKHFRFADPELNAFVKDDDIIVTAKGYARSVEIQAGADVVLSDNYFDMDGGVKAVKILRGSVDSVSVRSVWDIR